jgi:hypothetical protein
MYDPLLFPIHAMCRAHLILLDLITRKAHLVSNTDHEVPRPNIKCLSKSSVFPQLVCGHSHQRPLSITGMLKYSYYFTI